MTMDYLSETMDMKRKWQDSLKVLTEKTVNSEFYTSNEGDIKRQNGDLWDNGTVLYPEHKSVTQMYTCIKNL